jgi:hypothetical protein
LASSLRPPYRAQKRESGADVRGFLKPLCAKAFDASRCRTLHLLIFPIFLSAFLSPCALHPLNSLESRHETMDCDLGDVALELLEGLRKAL